MSRLDFAAVNTAAHAAIPRLISAWVPDGRRHGREWVGRNPRRADRHPGSFSINLDTGRWSDFATGDAGGDFVSLFAFLRGLAQGEAARALGRELGLDQDETVADVASAAGRSGRKGGQRTEDADWRALLPVPADAPPLTDDAVRRFVPEGLQPTAQYRYTSAGGDWLGSVIRYDRKANGLAAAKEFRSVLFCEGSGGRCEWRAKGFPVPRPLYGLAHLAGRPDAPVIITEGEKSAEAAARLFPDHVAVTSPNGSKSASKADWAPLANRHVVIWPDADEPGATYAKEVTELVKTAGAASARIVDLPGELPQGWDLADPLPDSLASLDLHGLLNAASAPRTEGPLPLFPESPPSEPYPIEALGPVLARAAMAIARKVQVPEAIAAQSVLAVAALAAQALADVQLPYGQTRPLSLFLVTVAASGDRKSSADNEALWPIAKREKALREAHAEDIKEWKAASAAWGCERKKIEADKTLGLMQRKDALMRLGDEPGKPLTPMLTTADLTMEGLAKNWAHAHAALGIFTAEGGQFSGGHGMSDDARLRTAAMLSELWDGKPVKRVRALDGITILPGRRLSMHIMIQPEAAAGFLGNGTLRDQGLLSRVLAAAPSSLAGTRLHRDIDPADEAAIRAYGARILSLLEAPLPLTEGTVNELEPPALAIEETAKLALAQFADHVERQCGSPDGLKPIVDFAAKAAEHAARIAGVLTIVADRRATIINLATTTDALSLAEWYVVETLRLQQAGRRDPKLIQAQALLEWCLTRNGDEVTFREVLQFGPGILRTKDAAEQAIAILISHGRVVEICPRPRRFRIVRSGAP